MNLPNRLTVARLYLCAALVIALEMEGPYRGTCAIVFFSLASITDWLDGYLARKWNQITDFGKLMDPLADKVLVSTAFIGLLSNALLPVWFVVAVITREFLVTGLRMLAASKGIILAAEKAGKHKTITQITTALTGLLILALKDAGMDPAITTRLQHLVLVPLIWLTLAVTVFSGMLYYSKNRKQLFSIP